MSGSKILFAHRKRLINVRLENYKPCHLAGLILCRWWGMLYKAGYVYHIKDEYFVKVHDDKLMQNKENGNYRPTFYCVRDEKTGLLWMVPLSSQFAKFKAIHDKQIERYGKCLTIILGKYDGRDAAFLLQNMFPITEYYLNHIHTRNGNPVPVSFSVHQKITVNMKIIKQLLMRGKKIVFPDVLRLEKLMMKEINTQSSE